MTKDKATKTFIFYLILFLSISHFIFPKKHKTIMDKESKEFYKYARYLFTKNEKKIFFNLPNKTTRELFIKYFWEIRDPTPYTSTNEFQLEIKERFEFVKKYLKEGPVPGWKTDRGRIYILLGPPNYKDEKFSFRNMNNKPVKIWYYNNSKIFIMFVDERGFGTYRMNLKQTSLALLNELENRKYYITQNSANFTTSTLKFNLQYSIKNNELICDIDSDKVTFKQIGLKMMSKFKINIMLYINKKHLLKKTYIKTLYSDKHQILKKNSKIQIRLPIKFQSGQTIIDTIITDLLGDSIGREMIKIKKLKIKEINL